MNDMTQIALNDRLAAASKKFTKACEQIKLLKQQLAVYIAMFSNFNDVQENSNSSRNNSNNTDELQISNQLSGIDYNINLSRETVRQKIESLQNFKNVFFMYAHQKAEEITKLQCQLYGEDAVRDAYETQSETIEPEPVIFSNTDREETNENETNEIVSNQFNDNSEMADEENSRWEQPSNYWNSYDQHLTNQQNELSNRPSQLQLIEYDFLTA